MTVLFTCNFESGLGQFNETNLFWTDNITPPIPHSGSYYGKALLIGSTGESGFCRKNLSGQYTRLYMEIWWHYVSWSQKFDMMRINNSLQFPTGFATIGIDKVGPIYYVRIGWIDGQGNFTHETTSTVIDTGITWNKFAIDLKIGVGDGYVKYYLNDNKIAEKIGLTNNWYDYVNQIFIGILDVGTNSDMWTHFDDLMVSDEAILPTHIYRTIIESIGARQIRCGEVPSIVEGITTRVKKVEILSKILGGVIDIDWIDTDPWVRLQVPSGPLLEQHLLGPQIEGIIRTYNYESLYDILYNTLIDGIHHPIDPDTSKAWVFSLNGTQFIITMEDAEGNEQVFHFINVRIVKVTLEDTSTSGLKEAIWDIHFIADIVTPEVSD